MNLPLTRPLIFFDLETTGVDVATDRIIEISILKWLPDDNKQIKTWRINPGIAIPAKSTEIHGITDEDVKDKPLFGQLAKTLAYEFEGCDIAGYNLIKFDLPLLVEEFLRVNIDFDIKKKNIIDVQVIFHKMEQRTLAAAYKFYCGKDLVNAHSAEADTVATFEVLKAQIERYTGQPYIDNMGNKLPGVENNVEELAKFTRQSQFVDFAGRIIYDENKNEVFNFGKYKGQKVTDVFAKDPSYFSWMMKGQFPLYTKKIITQIKTRNFGK